MRPRLLLAVSLTANLCFTSFAAADAWRRHHPPLPTTTLTPADVVFAPPWSESGALTVTFPAPATAAASDDLPADAPATLLHLQPNVPGRLRFVSRRQLEFTPDAPWPAATRLEAVLDPLARLVDGRRIGAQSLRFLPRPLKLDRVVIAEGTEGPQAAGHVLGLGFSLALDQSALRAALSVDAAWRVAALTADDKLGCAWRVEVVPVAAPAAAITLTVAGELHAGVGGEPLGEAAVRRVALLDEATVEDVTLMERGVRLHLSHELAMPTDDALTVSPPRPVTWERSGYDLVLRCAVAPGELVHVHAPAGFPGRGRFRVAAPIDDVLRAPDARPKLELPQGGSILSTRAEPVIDLVAVNVPRARVRMRRVYDNGAVLFAHARWSVPDEACTPWTARTRAIAAERNAERTIALDLRELWGAPLAAGWYQIAVEDGREDRDGVVLARGCDKLLQITDLACAVRCDAGDVCARVTSLADGTPVADAVVEVLSPTNQRLAFGRSGDDGVCRLHHATAAEDAKPFLVLVSSGVDRLALDLDRYRMDLVETEFAGDADDAGDAAGWLWSERGLVRPGEEIRLAGLVRDARGAAPFGLPVEVRLLAPDRSRARTWPLTLASDGLIDVRERLDPSCEVGTWRGQVWTRGEPASRLAECALRVEAFVPDRIGADAALAPLARAGVVADASALRMRIAAHWLTGEPCTSARAQVRFRCDPWTTALPDARAGWSFGPTRGGDAWRDVPPGVFQSRDAAAGPDGVVEARIDLPDVAGLQLVHVVADGTVAEPGGRPLPVAAAATVVTVPTLIGVRARVADGAIVVDACACDAAGADVALADPVRLRIERRRFRADVVERGGRLRWETTVQRLVLAETTVVPGEAATWPMPAAESDGWLVATVGVGDRVRGEQVIGDAPQPPDRIRCRALGAVAPGDDAQIDCASPIAGDALVTLEGVGIRWSGVRHLDAGTTRLRVPVPADATRANLHAVVLLATGQRGHAGPWWLAGGARIAVARPGWSTATLLTVPPTASPDAALPVRVLAPGGRRALVVAVDEGVLARTAHPVPDPLGHFARARALSGGGATSLADLLERPRWPLEPGGDGDDGEAPMLARVARRADDLTHLGAYAQWRAIDLDGAGAATVALPLDGFEGRLRIVAIAAGAAVCGAARADVVVRAPLGLRLAVPRVLAPGDEAVATLTVTARVAAGRCEIACDGRALRVDAIAALPPLARDRPIALPVRVTALAADDDAAVTVRARLTDADGVVTERSLVQRLPVRPIARFVEERHVVAVAGEVAWTPAGAWARPIAVAITAPRDRRDELRPALATLARYPHGCGEQLSSQVLVLAACSGLDDGEDARFRGLLPHGVARLRQLQRGGGFRWWPTGEVDPVITVHAVHALLAAQAAGVAVAASERARWLDAVEDVARHDRRLELRCQAVAALGVGGRAVGPWIDALAAKGGGRTARAWLAIAAAARGDAARARELVVADDADDAPPAAGDTLARIASPLRAAAIELRARLGADPGDPRIALLAERLLAAAAEPMRLTTSELAQILPALDAWCAVQAHAGGPPTLHARASGVEHAIAPGTTTTLTLPPGEAITLSATSPAAALLGCSGWRSDAALGSGDGVRIACRWLAEDAEKPVAALTCGRTYRLEVALRAATSLPTAVLTIPLPAGCEIDAAAPLAAGVGGDPDAAPTLAIEHSEIHDDRALVVIRGAPIGASRLLLRVRAVTVGRFTAAAPLFEAFYDPTLAAIGEPTGVMVQP